MTEAENTNSTSDELLQLGPHACLQLAPGLAVSTFDFLQQARTAGACLEVAVALLSKSPDEQVRLLRNMSNASIELLRGSLRAAQDWFGARAEVLQLAEACTRPAAAGARANSGPARPSSAREG